MPVTGDVLQILSFFSMRELTALMVSFWRYEQLSAIGPLTDSQVAEAFHTAFTPIVGIMLSQEADLTRTLVNNLTNGLTFGDYSEVVGGGFPGEALPAFNAISIKQNVGTRETRAGYKRFPYPGEGMSINGNVTIGAVDQATVEDFFGQIVLIQNPIDASPGGGLQPIVVGRTNMGTAEDPDYQIDLTRVQDVISAAIQPRVTSQTSRKAGT